MVMLGQARDIRTTENEAMEQLAEDEVRILASAQREILEIGASPERPALQALIGTRAGGQSRAALAETLPDEKTAGTPLYLLIDDFAGASLVAGWVFSRWTDNWAELARTKGSARTAGRKGKMEGVCAGFRPGSTALDENGWGRQDIQSWAEVDPLPNPEDPAGWHATPPQDGIGFRRSRWVDLWREGDRLVAASGFQDSGTLPNSDKRGAVHEYRVKAKIDALSMTLVEVDVDPRILPYRECPVASANAKVMLGTSVSELREQVIAKLTGTPGCTHLNDMLRSLADVPSLAAHL
jgi:hypothetical protein